MSSTGAALGDQGTSAGELLKTIRIHRPWQRVHLTFSITDSGPGIDAERRAELWTRFSPSQGGSGYGLYLVKQSVDRLQGRVSVDTAPRGMTVTVILPKLSAESAGARAPERAGFAVSQS